MAKRKFLYVRVWTKYLDQIKTHVELGLGAGFPIPASNFKKASIRSYYGFRLEIKNGKVVNDISGSAVARDLAYLLLEDPANKKVIAGKHFFVRMSSSFYLEVYPVKLYKDIMAGKIN